MNKLKHLFLYYYRNLKAKYKKIVHIITVNKNGRLSWPTIISLSFKALLYSRSRSMVTVGAIAIGTGAVVFLMSLGYGLQHIVTQRLVRPNSLRIADVQAESTALALTQESVSEIRRIPQVEDVATAISLASSVKIKKSKFDTITIGISDNYMEYANIKLTKGRHLSPTQESHNVSSYVHEEKITELEKLINSLNEAEVAGISTNEAKIIRQGESVKTNYPIRFRADDFVYVPIRQDPSASSKVIGYFKGDILNSHTGEEVWGGPYQSVGTVGHAYQDQKGNWFGKWIKAKLPIYQEKTSTIYEPLVDDKGKIIYSIGYVTQEKIKILTEEQIALERYLKLHDNDVLGESTSTASVASNSGELEKSLLSIDFSVHASDSAAIKEDTQTLKDIILSNKKSQQQSPEAHFATIEVDSPANKEILISTALLNVFKKTPNEMLNQKIELEYIISGGVIPKLNGKVISKPVQYKIVGIFKEDSNPIIFSPISDIESMGLKKYSLAKVLAKDEVALVRARERIQSIGFNTQSIADTLAQVNKLFSVIRFLLGSFGTIALVVSVFGMFNTLTISLLERTREVGVMKTLGTTDSDVFKLFIAESTLIGIVGGISGVLLGIILGNLTNLIYHISQAEIGVELFKTPWELIIATTITAIIIGGTTGLYPAFRSKKISPLNALRYE